MRRRLFCLTLLLALCLDLDAGEKKTVRLLTIGNSFSRNATNHLDELAAAAGHTLIHRPIIVGGASLELHAGKAKAHEADPQDLAGLYANGRSLRQELTADAWDFVTIQQASIKSHDYATYQPHALWLRDYIITHAPRARLLIHQTWPYRIDDPRFTNPSGKSGEPATQEAMYRGLRAAYDRLTTELGAAGILPVGDAFFAADSDAQWGYRPPKSLDLTTLKFPTLPDQARSLHIGWTWKKKEIGDPVLGMDGHHANLAGEYLGACVWFETLFSESVVTNACVPGKLAADHARFLRETAHRTVEARKKGDR